MSVRVLRDALFENGGDKDVTAGISPMFLKYNRNGLDNISIRFASSLTTDELEWAFDLVKTNMEDIYDASGYEWDDDDKRSELTEEGTRFLLIHDESSTVDDSAGVVEKPLIGFVHFRFTVQGEVMDKMTGAPVLYVWDIHVEESYQRKGLGKHLLVILELIARQQKMQALSIPVQYKDDVTAAWIQKTARGYVPDEGLKALVGFDSDLEGFQVYTKSFHPVTTTAVVVAGTVKTDIAVMNTQIKKEVVDTSIPSSTVSIANDNVVEAAATCADVITKTELNNDILVRISEDSEIPLSQAVTQLKDMFRVKHAREATDDDVALWTRDMMTTTTSNGNNFDDENELIKQIDINCVINRNKDKTAISATAAAADINTDTEEPEEYEGFQVVYFKDIPSSSTESINHNNTDENFNILNCSK